MGKEEERSGEIAKNESINLSRGEFFMVSLSVLFAGVGIGQILPETDSVKKPSVYAGESDPNNKFVVEFRKKYGDVELLRKIILDDYAKAVDMENDPLLRHIEDKIALILSTYITEKKNLTRDARRNLQLSTSNFSEDMITLMLSSNKSNDEKNKNSG